MSIDGAAGLLDRDFKFTPIENPPTDYGKTVTENLKSSSKIDQKVLQRMLRLASTHLITDLTMNDNGVDLWYAGLNQIIELMLVLDKRDELELDTVNAASKACSECWGVGGNWKCFERARVGVKKAALKLKGILDENNRYRGQPVYAT